jgi:hypothetical protein
MIVQRTVNGSTRRYVEFMEARFDTDEGKTQATAFFVDSGLSYDGSATATVSGLDHLLNDTVHFLGNGDVYSTQAVTGYSVGYSGLSSISPTVEKAQIGLPYYSTIKTLRPEAGSDDGVAQGKMKRVFEVTIRFIQTLGAFVGPLTSVSSG